MYVWDFASRQARKGPWEQAARDRERFHRRIQELNKIIEPML
ncbi:GSCOCG00011909001-RA-CDS, partial [Cotesia congregata]